MTNPTGVQPERRKHVRIAPKGTVVLDTIGHAQRGRLANLSEGGMLLVTPVRPPDRVLGRQVSFDLRLDGQLADWLHGSGRIVRVGGDGTAVAFDSPPPTLIRMIDDMSRNSRASLRTVSVMLIDADHERRIAMALAFRDAGCRVIEGATSLEAIVRLGESAFEPDLIAVGDSVQPAVAAELRQFVEREHPDAKLVTIGDDVIEPSGIAHWLSSSNPRDNLPERIRTLLFRPRRVTQR
ncbi:MAG: PilZ domain-containing protein [Deltaproteobacteria bacterium]|nr:PilZ domain-containing protein [Deltaproteobacteria bacterium]